MNLSNINIRSRLSRRLILSSVLFSSVISLIITAIQLYGDYRAGVIQIHDKVDQVQTAYLKSLTNSVWALDTRQINTHLEGLSQLSDIDYVSITVAGDLKWAVGNKLSESSLTYNLPMSVTYNNEIIEVGVLNIYAGLDVLYQRIVSRAIFILIANGIKTLFVVGFMLVIIYYFVTQHLTAIADYFRRQKTAKNYIPLALPRKARKDSTMDELDELVDAINSVHNELHQSHQEVLERGNQIQLLLSSTAEAIYGIDTQGFITFVNPSCVHILGYDNDEEMLGKNVYALIHHSFKDETSMTETDCQIYKTLKNDRPFHSCDEVFWRKNKASLPVEYWSYPIRRKDKVVGAVVTFLDITERLAAENALKDSEKRFRTLANAAPVGIYRTDAQGNCIYVNDKWCELSGLTTEEAYGADWSKALYSEDKQRVLREWQESVTSKTPFNSEYRFKNKHGKITWVVGQAFAEWNEQNLLSGFVGSITDITDQKQAEAELAKHGNKLESMVADRTFELELKNKELESFCYSVSHDLRAPLRSIDGFSNILLDDYSQVLDEQGLKYLQRCSAASQRMAQLIDGLLSLSRVGRSTFRVEKLNISAMVAEICQILSEAEPERKVKVSIQENIELAGDRSLFRIALENLIRNAWKFTGQVKSPKIEVREIQSDHRKVISIKDNGAGFDMRYSDKLFGPFQRLHHAKEFDGTGIGLATVQRVIHRHGGEIWADARPGKGATFYFNVNKDLASKITSVH